MSSDDRIMKLNEQLFTSIIVLCNVLDSEKGVTTSVKSAVAASLISMINRSMTEEDDALKNLLNHSIDRFCAEIEEKHEVESYREVLQSRVEEAQSLVDELNLKAKRIKEGEDILKGICLN